MRRTTLEERASTAAAMAMVISGCTAPAPAPDPALHGLPGPDLPVRFQCGGRQATAAFTENGVRLTVDGHDHALARTPAASGARYADADESAVFWDRGERALVTVDGRTLPECRRDAGGVYTASGTEPGWRLVIGPVRLQLEADYGAQVVETATPAPRAGPDSTARYRAESGGQPLTVKIERRYCENAMSGKPFPDTVSVTWEGRRLHGCGGDPKTLLTGRPWRVDTLSGARVPAAAAPTITFETDCSVAGFDGCNRFHGRYRITGVGLEFSALATTRMACPGEGDALARRFHARLADVALFRLDGEDRLVLGSHGEADGIIAVRGSSG